MPEMIGSNIRITPGGFSKKIGMTRHKITRSKGPTYANAMLVNERAKEFLKSRGLVARSDQWSGTQRPHSPRKF